jgi:hypothetical protein
MLKVEDTGMIKFGDMRYSATWLTSLFSFTVSKFQAPANKASEVNMFYDRRRNVLDYDVHHSLFRNILIIIFRPF